MVPVTTSKAGLERETGLEAREDSFRARGIARSVHQRACPESAPEVEESISDFEVSSSEPAMATLRRDARALVDAVRASGSRVIKNFDADDDGVCVSMTLERGHTSNLTLIFEVRTPPMAPNHSSFLGLDAPHLPFFSIPLTVQPRSPTPISTNRTAIRKDPSWR